MHSTAYAAALAGKAGRVKKNKYAQFSKADEVRKNLRFSNIDDGPLGIVFAHTSTPAATEKSWDNGFHMHKITEVMPGSAADRCGLRANDTLIRVHDQLVDSMSEHDLRIHFGAVKGTRSMNIEVLRMQPSGPHTTTSELVHLVLTRVVERASKAKLGSQSGEQGATLTSDPLGLSMTATETLGQMQSTRASTKISPWQAHPTTNAHGQRSSSPHAAASIARSGGSDHVNGFPAVSPAQEDLPGLFGLEATPATKNNRVGHTLLTPGQQIDEEGTTALGEALKTNNVLTTLWLNSNRIHNPGAIALAAALKSNRALTTLWLNSNSVGDEGATALAEALTIDRALTTLGLPSNNIGDAGATALTEALKIGALTTLELDGNSFGEAGANAIIAARAAGERVRNREL